MTLSMAPRGKYKVISLPLGKCARCRCKVRGLIPGSIIRIKSLRRNPIIVIIKGSEWAIGRGLASKIIVRKVD